MYECVCVCGGGGGGGCAYETGGRQTHTDAHNPSDQNHLDCN